MESQLVAMVDDAITEHEGSQALAAAVAMIVAFASVEAARARFLMSESMAGGSRALDVRDAGIARLADLVGERVRRAKSRDAVADVDLRVVLGGIYRVLANRLRRGDPAVSKLTDELHAWLASYERPSGQLRWRTLAPAGRPAPSLHVPNVPIQQMPNALPPGRPRISEEEVAENHRLRILYAAARMAETKGYMATTVQDITRLARVDGRVFYRLFADKQEAFMTVHELGFQQVMDVTSRAYFAGTRWPERSWEGGRALTHLLEQNPLVAHVGFVEAYAVGPGAVQRVEDSHTAFMFFLHEGLVFAKQEHPPSRVTMEAIITSIFELIYLQARETGKPKLATMLPYIAHLWLTPFLGPAEADMFIEGQLKTERRKRNGSARASKARARAGKRSASP